QESFRIVFFNWEKFAKSIPEKFSEIFSKGKVRKSFFFKKIAEKYWLVEKYSETNVQGEKYCETNKKREY
ncbi:hypothetical protein, partial [Candidatus Methanodesulfokora washburnensis]